MDDPAGKKTTDTDQDSTFSHSINNNSFIDPETPSQASRANDDDDNTDATSVTSLDSGFWEVESSTHSVNSSIFDYEISHGRTYHAYHQGQYLLPNDADEIERIEVKYHAIRLALQDNLFFAPLDSPTNILDVGTGTGTWAVDTADTYPATIVKGIDLSPIQPNYVPPNCFFEIADADDDWTFTTPFDLIHTRIMNDFSLRSWPRFFEQAYHNLAPGGWVECQEFDYHRHSDDNTIPETSRLKFWEQEWTRGMNRIGLGGQCEPEVVMQQMRDAGLINVHTKNFKMPIGPWPKDPALKQCGLFGLVNLLDGIHGLSVKIFTELLGYSTAELEVLLMECRKDVTQKRVHSYYPVYVILGQRPVS